MGILKEGFSAIRGAAEVAYNKNKVDENGKFLFPGRNRVSPYLFTGGYLGLVKREKELDHKGLDAHTTALLNIAGGTGVALNSREHALKAAAKQQVGLAAVSWGLMWGLTTSAVQHTYDSDDDYFRDR